MHEKGRGVAQSSSQAVLWYRKAADQGFLEAQTRLAICFEEGIGTARDPVEAYKWFNLAAAQGSKNAAAWRDRLAQGMTAAQIAEAQHRATQFLAKRPVALALAF
jgi:TPR repeat protein